MTTLVSLCNTSRVSGAGKSIGQRIRDARERAGLSRPQLAAQVGCSPGVIKSYELLKDKPPAKNATYFRSTLALLGVRLEDDPSTDAAAWVAAGDPPISQASWLQLVQAARALQPDNPPLSMADAKQLVSALSRVIYGEPSELDWTSEYDLVVSDVPLSDQTSPGDTESQV